MENCHPPSERKANKSVPAFAKKYSSIFSLIILILPKCPLCIAAYSGAVAICGVTPLITHHESSIDWRVYVALGISIMITGCILFTYRARAYYIATIIMALCGMLLVCIGLAPKSTELFRTDVIACYYAGASLLVAAVFIYSGITVKLFKVLKIRSFAIQKI